MATTKKKNRVLQAVPTGSGSANTESSGLEPMRIEISRIQPYERNPRRNKNPEYDRIRASIREAGMDQPLLITRRPGEDDFIVQGGGNTRLEILKELYTASQDQRFFWADCVFVEWESESTVLLAHLRENDLRGNLNFIERAQAVISIGNLLAEESGVTTIPQRELEAELRKRGYSASQGLISLMGYAHTLLLPHMPAALDAGLGKRKAQRIRRLHNAARAIWLRLELGSGQDLDEVFAALCRRYDCPDWELEPLQRAIEVEIAEAAEVSLQEIRMELSCRLAGHEPEIPTHVTADESAEPQPLLAGELTIAESVAAAQATADQATTPDEHSAAKTVKQTPGESADDAAEIAIEIPATQDPDAVFRRIAEQHKQSLPVELLRKSAFQLAERLARRHGLGDLVEALPDTGLGYFVTDVPSQELLDPLDDSLLGKVSGVWWQLVALAGLAEEEAVEALNTTHSDAALVSRLKETDLERLSKDVPTPHPAYVAEYFYRNLNHEDWCDWVLLIHHHRELRRAARRQQINLWRSPT